MGKRKRNASINRQNDWNLQNKLSYTDASKYLKDNNVKKIVEERHITMGWQHVSNLKSILHKTIKAGVGQYIQKYKLLVI